MLRAARPHPVYLSAAKFTTIMARTRSPAAKAVGKKKADAKSDDDEQAPTAEEHAAMKSRLNILNEEVEGKLRIPDSASFAAVKSILLPSFKTVHDQENHFFDGAEKELSSQKVVLRVRFYGADERAVITVKGKQVLKDGIGRAPEEEEDVDPAAAREFIKDSSALLAYNDSKIVQKLKDEFKFTKGLSYLGGFDNKRHVYNWRGFNLEVDQTSYPWGSMYEIECETDKPETLKESLETLLREHNIPFGDSKRSKFANFAHKTLI